MNKETRLNLIRQAAKRRPALTEQASAIIEELRTEDPDLGGIAYGETLAPDSVRVQRVEDTEDENEANTELVSPFMRDIQAGEARDLKAFEHVS